MILVDHQIRKLCIEGFITPFDPSLINPASIDVRLGDTAVVEHLIDGEPQWLDWDLNQYSEENPYWLQPKEFILLSTLEVFDVPVNLVGEFRLTSTRGRQGYNNCLAVFVDPGYHGSVLTLEVINECRYTQRPLYPGMIIGQIFLKTCDSIPERSYRVTGRYNNCLQVAAAREKLIASVQSLHTQP